MTTDRITLLADELETEARIAGAKHYKPGEIGYHGYTRRYLAEIAARRIIAAEDLSTPTRPDAPSARAEEGGRPDRSAASHAERGAA